MFPLLLVLVIHKTKASHNKQTMRKYHRNNHLLRREKNGSRIRLYDNHVFLLFGQSQPTDDFMIRTLDKHMDFNTKEM